MKGGAPRRGIAKRYAGQTPDGLAVYQYVLTNKNGMQAAIITYGGIMTSLKTPDRSGKLEDIVLGYPALEDYWTTGNKNYFGALIGRYANRIADGRFMLDGVVYRLSVNDGPNTLHGGMRGFDKQVWRAEEVWRDGVVGLSLRYLSRDGEEGFPGNVDATVVYTLTDGNELRIDYAATSDKPTVVNLTQHNYYNLSGAGKGNILGHIVAIHSDRYTPVRPGLIPTGEVLGVAGTPLDFRQPTPVGARIHSDDPQMRLAGGYDFNYVIRHGAQSGGFAASVYDPVSGRSMEVYTTQPAVQFYTGNSLDGSVIGKEGIAYERYAGLTLETQHYPDSPNRPQFPSTVLVPGQLYRHASVYKFSAV
ncbi:aldose epimerase family protein [Cohnella sp.]|uniref:aldose epimerase family protein n=1 Tax=Cohnella sp. TaxID=1883426 RepID=UPI003568FC76